MEKKPELLVIDPSIIRPEIETFHLVSRLSPVAVSFHLPALEGMDSLWEAEKSAQCIGALVVGSAASVREKREWQASLIRWIENKKHPKFPILGICFGHQLLAYMHGASVVDCGKRNIGFRTVDVFEDKRLGLSAAKVPLFVAHNDRVDELPEGFELFASSELISIDGLRHKTLPIWSFQPHIDATEAFALNCQYTDRSEFHQLELGNSILHKFIRYTTSQFIGS